MTSALQNLTIETGGVLLAVTILICGVVAYCWAIYPKKDRIPEDHFLRNSPERRYRVEQE